MSIKIATESSSMSSSSSSSISFNTVSSLRHHFDSNSGNNKSYGSNVNRLRSVFVTQQQQQQQLKKQKLNNEDESDNDQQQQQQRNHQSRPLIDETSTTSTSNSNNNNRSRSLSTPRITTKQIIIKSNEDYDKSSPTTIDSSTLQTNTNINNIIDSLKNNNDHLTRFQSAKALFARIEEEAKQAKQQQFIIQPTTTPSISINNNNNSRRSLNFNVINNNNKIKSTPHHRLSSLPTSNLQIQQQQQQQISPPSSSSSSLGLNIKRKGENKENVKTPTTTATLEQPITVNYRFNNYLNGVVSNNDEIIEQQQQRRSWSKLQPHGSPPSRNSLTTSISSPQSSSPSSPSSQPTNSIQDILNQISSSKLLTASLEFPITNTTPQTTIDISPPSPKKSSSPSTPPSTPVLTNSLKINVLDSNENLVEENSRRKLFDDEELVNKIDQQEENLLTDQEASEIEVLLKSWNKSCNLNNLNKETPPSTSIDCGVVNIVFSSSETNEFKNKNEMITDDLNKEEFVQYEEDRLLQAPSNGLEHEDEDEEEQHRRIDTTEVDDDGNNRDENGNYFYEIDGLSDFEEEEEKVKTTQEVEEVNVRDYDSDSLEKKKKNRKNGGSRVKFTNTAIRVYTTFSTVEYDRRNEDIDPIGASAEYELEKRIEKMDVFEVELERGNEGLGLSIIGMGVGAEHGLQKLGIFIKTIPQNGTASRDGRLKIGDQIIEVDGESLVGVTQTFAASVLRATKGVVRFLIGREKEFLNSEIARLIQQSLEQDRIKEDINRASQLAAPPNPPPPPPPIPKRTFPSSNLFSDLDTSASFGQQMIFQNQNEPKSPVPSSAVQPITHNSPVSPIDSFNTNNNISDANNRNSEEYYILEQQLHESEIKNQFLENELNNLNTKLNLLKAIEFEKEAIEKQYNLNRILCDNLTNKNNELEKVIMSNKIQMDNYRNLIEQSKSKYAELELKYSNSKKFIKELQLKDVEQQTSKNNEVKELQQVVEELEEKIAVLNKKIKEKEVIKKGLLNNSGSSTSSSIKNESSNCESIVEENVVESTATKVELTPSYDTFNLIDRNPILDNEASKFKSVLIKRGSLATRNLPTQQPTRDLFDLVNDLNQYEAQHNNNSSDDSLEVNNDNNEPTYGIHNSGLFAFRQQNTSNNLVFSPNNLNSSPQQQQQQQQQKYVGNSFASPMEDWSCEAVAQWLIMSDMQVYADLFLKNSIDGEKLVGLDNSKLKTIGIKSQKDRDLIKTKVKEMKADDKKRFKLLLESNVNKKKKLKT